MLTVPVDSPTLPAGWAAEPKWDGYRAQLAVHRGGRVLLRSRQGTDMTGSFPEIRSAALAQLPADTGLVGELVVWEAGRLAFERLQQRLARRGKGASEAAGKWPAHYVAFDLLHQGESDLTGWPYRQRRAALEALFAERGLAGPLTLCPSTTDPTVAQQWLQWTAAGLEGLCFKRLDEPYRPVRSWRKYKIRVTTEAIVGAVPARWPRPARFCWAATTAPGACSAPAAAPPCPRLPAAPSPSCSPHPRPRTPGTGGRSARGGGHSAPSMCTWCSPTSSWKWPSTSPEMRPAGGAIPSGHTASAPISMPPGYHSSASDQSTVNSGPAHPRPGDLLTTWEVTGRTVAVRRPAWNDGPVATPNSPVHHYLHRGDRVTSCTVAIARTEHGPAYRKCGRGGNVWGIVPGGQVPRTCLKRVR
jgi:hypothetical protein